MIALWLMSGCAPDPADEPSGDERAEIEARRRAIAAARAERCGRPIPRAELDAIVPAREPAYRRMRRGVAGEALRRDTPDAPRYG